MILFPTVLDSFWDKLSWMKTNKMMNRMKINKNKSVKKVKVSSLVKRVERKTDYCKIYNFTK
jgi:hypothetical protein